MEPNQQQVVYPSVVVIGCDKTGKSTLIKGLLQALPEYHFFKGDKQPSPQMSYDVAYKHAVELAASGNKVIHDRFHYPDDIVYHPVFNGGESLPDKIQKMYRSEIIPILQAQPTLFIYCSAAPEIIAKRFVLEKEELVNPKFIRDLLHNYDQILDELKGNFRVLSLRSDVLTPAEMLNISLTYIQEGKL